MPDVGRFAAVLLDLDGVPTSTAEQHYRAWKVTFDEILRRQHAMGFDPFTWDDYRRYVDGMPRHDGVRRFAVSRDLDLPEGDPADPPTSDTIYGVAAHKNDRVDEIIRREGVEVFPDAREFVRSVRAAGLKTAVVSASRNCETVLEIAGLTGLFDVQVDGRTVAELGLAGKPAPDSFLRAAQQLEVEPRQCVVIEDAVAGVAAGRAGGFGLVVGIDRGGRGDGLLVHGAHVVVNDLSELLA